MQSEFAARLQVALVPRRETRGSDTRMRKSLRLLGAWIGVKGRLQCGLMVYIAEGLPHQSFAKEHLGELTFIGCTNKAC